MILVVLQHIFSSTVYHIYFPGVREASKEVFRSRRLKKHLELVLAMGNFINKGQRGSALGFKISSLNKMIDTKASTNKNMTLLHYLVEIIEKKVCGISFILFGRSY